MCDAGGDHRSARRLVAALWRWLDRNPDGRYVLRLDPARFVYLEYADGSAELYDLVKDPHQAVNRAGGASFQTIRARYRALLQQLRTCDGAACAGFGTDMDPPAERPAPW